MNTGQKCWLSLAVASIRMITSLGIFVLTTNSTLGQVLRIDFGQNEQNPLQGEFEGFNPWGATSTDNGNPVTQTYSSDQATDGTIDVTVQGQSHWRDYAPLTGGAFSSMSSLLSDEVLNSSGGTITITISDLKPGSYYMSTYHHASENGGNTTYDLKLTDANATDKVIASGMTSSLGTSPGSINKQTFPFDVNASSNDVSIKIGPGGAAGNNLVINGFELGLNLPTPVITIPSSTYAYPIPVNVTFEKMGVPHTVSGFDASEINATGATVGGFAVSPPGAYPTDGPNYKATTAEATIISSSPALASYPVAKAFDSDHTTTVNNRWLPEQSSLPNVYLTWQFTKPFQVTEYKLMVQDFSFEKRGPKDFMLQGSDDNSSWTTLDTENNQTGWTADETRSYLLDSPGTYSYYKLLISAAEGSDTYIGFREIELWGVNGKTFPADSRYTFELTPNTDPATINLSIDAGAATGADGNSTVASSAVIQYESPLTRADDLTLWYQFNENNSTTAVDSAGSNPGTLTNMDQLAAWMPGKFGNALQFDGTNDYVLATGYKGILGTSARSVSLWFKTTAGGSFVSFGTMNVGGQAYRLWMENGMLRLEHNGGAIISTNTYNDGGWHHLGSTQPVGATLADVTFYLDGTEVPDNGGSTVAFDTVSDVDVRIGHTQDDVRPAFNGLIDDVRIYDVALTAAEIAAIYNGGTGDLPVPVVTGPASAVANPGFPFITSDFNATKSSPPASTIWAAIGLPASLEVNASTGKISGTPTDTPAPTGTTSNAFVSATNGYGTTYHAFAITLYPLPSSVSVGTATDIGLYGAKLNGSFADGTGTDCVATLCVDYTDKGTANPSDWAHSFQLGVVAPGAIAREITGLAIDTAYSFRFAVTNAGGALFWSDTAGTFTTMGGLTPPLLGEVNAYAVNSTEATIVGSLTDTGGETPSVTIVWGDEDRGSDFNALSTWDNVITLGLLGTGSFSTNLTGLQAGKVYYARTAAVNVAGEVVSKNLAVFAPSPYSGLYSDGTVKTSNLVLWYKFDETTGSTVADSGNGGNPATLINGPAFIAGKFGNAMQFDGANDHVLAAGYKGISGANQRTMVAWVKTSKASAAIMSWGEDTSGKKWIFRTDNGKLRVEVNGGAIVGNTSVSDDQWHHVAAVLPAGKNNVNQMKLYVNGVDDGLNSASNKVIDTASTDDFKIGNDQSNRYFQGFIDDVRIYDKSLSDEDVSNLYNGGFGDQFVPPAITSATEANATVGQAFTYQVTSTVTTPSYSAFGLPSGLTCNLSTGAITGSPEAGGVYLTTLLADGPSETVTGTLTITIPVSAPTIANSNAINIVSNAARLVADIPNTGGRDANVTVYWGTVAGGQSSWQNEQNLGMKGIGGLARDVSGLASGTLYHYRFKADNSQGGTGDTVWTVDRNFTTASSASPPVLGNVFSVTGVTDTSAKFNGSLAGTGGGRRHLRLPLGPRGRQPDRRQLGQPNHHQQCPTRQPERRDHQRHNATHHLLCPNGSQEFRGFHLDRQHARVQSGQVGCQWSSLHRHFLPLARCDRRLDHN